MIEDGARGAAGGALSLADQAYLAIRELIVGLAIPPGAPLQEDRLCKDLGLGRTPVREAIKRLEAERLVVIFPRRGTFASDINIADHALLADVRRQLEGLAATRAAQRVSGEDRDRARSLIARLDDIPTESSELIGLDAEVHAAIYDFTKNKYLATTLMQYYNLARRIWRVFLDQVDLGRHLEGHRALLQAIVDGDADGAGRLAVAHVDDFETAVVRSEIDMLAGTAPRPAGAAGGGQRRTPPA